MTEPVIALPAPPRKFVVDEGGSPFELVDQRLCPIELRELNRLLPAAIWPTLAQYAARGHRLFWVSELDLLRRYVRDLEERIEAAFL